MIFFGKPKFDLKCAPPPDPQPESYPYPPHTHHTPPRVRLRSASAGCVNWVLYEHFGECHETDLRLCRDCRETVPKLSRNRGSKTRFGRFRKSKISNNFPATERDPRPTTGPTPGVGSLVPMVPLPELRARAGKIFKFFHFFERERQRNRARDTAGKKDSRFAWCLFR